MSDIQYKLLVRITLSLVDTVPCIGGATLSLLAPPHVDYKLRLAVRPAVCLEFVVTCVLGFAVVCVRCWW